MATMRASAPITTTISIGRTFALPTTSADSDTGDGNLTSSLPQMFSATFFRMMPMAMVDMIQPSDWTFIAGRTPMRSMAIPYSAPNASTSGIISQ